jgi:Protein of unknown function (DUF2510)
MSTPDQPGWYDDPNDSNALRYWDGQSWTPHRERKQLSRAAPQPSAPRPVMPPPPPASSAAQPPPPASSAALPPRPEPQAQWPPSGQPSDRGAPRRSRMPIVIVALVAAAVLLAGGGVFAYKFLAGGSDEDQIKALVGKFTTDFNKADGAGIASLTCSEGTKAPAGARAFVAAATSEELRAQLDENGTASTSVANVHVTGNRATAQVTTIWSKSPGQPDVETDSFAKESGSWKVCGAAS